MKNKKVKEIHLRVPLKLSEEIENNKNVKTKNEAYMKVLYRGTKNNDILVRVEKLENEIDIIKKYDKYAIFLLEQIYADLEFEKRDKNKSKNLIELKKEFQKINQKKDHSL